MELIPISLMSEFLVEYVYSGRRLSFAFQFFENPFSIEEARVDRLGTQIILPKIHTHTQKKMYWLELDQTLVV